MSYFQIRVEMSDVKMSLTQNQYISLMGLVQAIPRVFALDEEDETLPGDDTPLASPTPATPSVHGSITSLAPELRPMDSKAIRSKLDLIFQVHSIRLSLYDQKVVRESDYKDTGIARLTLNENTVRVKMLADGAMEAEVVLQTFTMTNTRPGKSRFREVIPAEKNREQAQVMVFYSTSGAGSPPASQGIITVDSPKILFALDPTFALLSFLTSPFPPAPPEPPNGELEQTQSGPQPAAPSTIAFRFDLYNASITVLEDDEQANSQAMQLVIQQVSLVQQVRYPTILSDSQADSLIQLRTFHCPNRAFSL